MKEGREKDYELFMAKRMLNENIEITGKETSNWTIGIIAL